MPQIYSLEKRDVKWWAAEGMEKNVNLSLIRKKSGTFYEENRPFNACLRHSDGATMTKGIL